MARKELKEVLQLITAVHSDPRLGGQRDQLLKLSRELRELGRCGKVKRREVFAPIQRIAEILSEVLKL